MVFIPGGDDFTPSFRHNYAPRGDCYDGSTPHNGRCLNDLYPTGGYFLLQLSILNEYPIYGTMLILLYWEYPIAGAALVLYCLSNRTKRTIVRE